MEKGHFGDQSSDSDPYESGQDSARPESSDDENARGAPSDDGDSLLIHANESDSERFDPTEGESTFMLEGAWHPTVGSIFINTRQI